MSGNRFGTLFQYQTFGESHGPAIGCIVDGVPPGLPLCEEDIQCYLDRRRPGQSRYTTQRSEPDRVQILSGVFEGMTTGTPIGLMIENLDAKSKDYSEIKDKFRPGHADFTYQAKYGIRDYRGGGRASARETAMRVAAGAIARKIITRAIGESVSIRGAAVQIGKHKINRENWDWNHVESNPFFSPDEKIVKEWESYLDEVRKEGSSIGAIVEVHAEGIPAGLGAPVYDKLDADIAKAMMSINAVKAVEIGGGFAASELKGEENIDEMKPSNKGTEFLSNHAGGILGGVSTGQKIVTRIAFKPTSSILKSASTLDAEGKETEVSTKGRHDPCVGIRGVPVAEAMMACVLADHWLRYKAQCL
jgi:chorismate synthase